MCMKSIGNPTYTIKKVASWGLATTRLSGACELVIMLFKSSTGQGKKQEKFVSYLRFFVYFGLFMTPDMTYFDEKYRNLSNNVERKFEKLF